MVNINVSSLTIGGRSYNKDKSGYPALPTVFSGVEVVWGAASCIDHPEPSRATISLWVPKTHESYVPTLGEVISVKIADVTGIGYEVSLFNGKVESVKIKDDHKADGGYRINVVAADALAEAARLRLADSMWPFESVLNRQRRIADLASKNGVSFDAGLTAGQGYYEALDTDVRARDVDSYPALEAFQRTTMAAGHTVISANNVVQPSISLELPQNLGADDTDAPFFYVADNAGSTKSIMIDSNWNEVRENYATSSSDLQGKTGFSTLPGTGGVTTLTTVVGIEGVPEPPRAVEAQWTTGATAGTQGLRFQKNPYPAGVSGSKVSAGIWLMSPVTTRTFKLGINLLNGATPAGSGLSANFTAPANTWVRLVLNGVTATSAYTDIQVDILAQANMTTGSRIDVNSLIIEKAATVGNYFDFMTLDPAANIVSVEQENITHIDSSAVEDDVFELDTSKVVNEIKVEMKRFIGSVGEPGWEAKDSANAEFDQIFTDEAGSRKTTPQTRSIATDWAIRDAYMDDELPNSVMVTKGKLLLSGQSKAQWRMSGPLKLVLKNIEGFGEQFNLILMESDRFGSLIKLDNGPSLLPSFMRVRGGRIVLGENSELELDVEPVEYSAPIPLTKNTLMGDQAVYYKLRNYKTLSSNDLRTIGAR